MNKIYRLKFDKRRNELVVVSEIATGMGKEKSTGHIAALSDISTFRKLLGTLTPLALLTGLVISLFPGMALANPDLPTDGLIVGGQGSISTSGNQMTIHQQTQNMATNWKSFDIGKNNTVQFVQPDSSSVALNRVTGDSGSQIMGTLKANGQVFILNPNGVLFGKDARVNVAGLVASTKNINADDFMKGQYTLSGEGNTGSQVVNQGSLTTSKGGYIVLAGERVSNSGTVTTPGGKTVLAAGKTVTLQLDKGGLTSVSVDGSVVNALVENRGLISATDGQVYLTAKGKDMLLNTVVNNSGTIEAKGLESRGGEIVLNGGDSGVVSQSGTLLADSHTGQGGKITLEGQNIHLAGNSLTSATGKTGGGEVYVGGGWQGKDSRIRNASKVVMDKTATIDVSATDTGNGGTTVLWSDDYTNFRGTVLAKGGTQSGNGGRVETSSHKNLQAFGDVDTSARAGKGGEWLLDPTDMTIVGTPDSESGVTSSTESKILNTSIVSQLNKGTNVTIQTSGVNTEGQKGNITIAKDVSITKNNGGEATLTLLADNNILVGGIGVDTPQNVSISSESGALNLNLLAGKTVNDGSAQVYLGKNPTISLNGGDFVVGSALGNEGKIKFVAERGMGKTITARNISIKAMGNGGMNTNGLGLNATGSIDITASSVKSLSDYGHNVTWNAGDHLTVNSTGGINLLSNNNDNPATTTLSGVNGVEINSHNGTLSMAGNTKKDKNSITISSSKGSVSLSGTSGQDVNGYGGNDALILTNVNITSEGKTRLDGLAYWAKAAELTGLNITAGGDVDISGIAKRLIDNKPGGAKALGIKLSGSKIESKKGNITLTGFAATDKSYQNISTLEISNSSLTANNSTGKISLTGTTETTTGVRVADSNFSAASVDIKGVATQQGTGFSLTNSHMQGSLADLAHVTFSSAGSAAGAMNLLDSSIVTDSNRERLMNEWVPENLTRLDMGNKAIFDDTLKGWKKNYSSNEHPNGGWIFDNTKVTAGGTVDLKGVSFTNSKITVTKGDLKIDNVGSALLDDSTVKVSDGNVSVHSSKGHISLNKGNISAGKDITLTADEGGVGFVNSTVTSGGHISASGNGGDGIGVKIEDTDFTAGKNINITGQTTGGGGLDDEQFGGVFLYGIVEFHAKNGEVKGTVNRHNFHYYAGGVNMGMVFKKKTSILFDGSFNINGASINEPDSRVFDYGILNSGGSNTGLTFSNGVSTYWGEGAGTASGAGMKYSSYVTSAQQDIIVNSNASLNMVFRAKKGYAVYPVQEAYASTDAVGYKFTGGGDVSIVANNDSSRPTIYANLFSNKELTGSFSINANNKSGNAILMEGHVDANLVNASITGTSGSSAGITINTTGGKSNPVVNLGNNKITGKSETGAGIVINGKNVTITNGVLKGTVTSGTRPGISLQGGDAFTLDGVKVTGESADGAGVSVSGTLQVNNGTYVNGTASGTGAGIAVNGTLTTTAGDGVHLDGKANSGDGILVKGKTSLMNARVNGTSVSGTGTNIDGPLTLSGTTSVKGKSTTGSGLNIAKKVTVAEADRDKISFTGESGSGTGVKLGSTASVSGGILTATSVDGPGLQVENGAQAENVEINAQTVNGQAISGDDNALTATNTSISTVGEAGNTNIANGATPAPGGTPSGVVAEAFDKFRENIGTLQKALNTKRADLGGLQQTMVALQKQFDQAVRTGAIGQPDQKRLETLVNGVSDSLHTATVTVAELNDAISSLKVDDAGMLGENQKTADRLSAGLQGLTLPAAGDISAVAGELNAAKTLQSATVSLQGSLAARTDEDGKVRHLLDILQQQLKDAQEKGTAGGAVLAGMQTQLESLDLQQRSYEEALAHIRQNLATVSQDGSSPVTGRQDSVNRLQTALSGMSGISDGQVSALGNHLQQETAGYTQLVTAVQQQGSVNAQTLLQNRGQQDGFHAGGEPTVPVHGYQAQPQNVDIRLCDGEGCRSVTLDVAKPSQGLMVASTESR